MSATALLFVAVLLPSVILHEVAHGAVALRFGDDTAQRAGRLTLNPLPHIDPFGTILLPLLLAISGAPVFGWARPVPVRPSLMRRPRDHGLLTSLAGPAVNVALALAAGLALGALGHAASQPVGRTLTALGLVNVILAVFNLLPVPPLDGSAVVRRVLPAHLIPAWQRMERYSMFVLLALVVLLPNVLSPLFGWAIDLWSVLL